MRTLIYLAILGMVVAGVIWAWQRLREGPTARLTRPRQVSPLAAGSGRVEEPATSAYGPDTGPGVLRLTPSQLIFMADSGRVTVLERLDIIGVTATRDLPDRTLAQRVLAVTTRTDTYYFAVGSTSDWELRLT